MELQAWILRSFLVQLETKEAAGEEAPDGIAEEFAVSQVVGFVKVLLGAVL